MWKQGKRPALLRRRLRGVQSVKWSSLPDLDEACITNSPVKKTVTWEPNRVGNRDDMAAMLEGIGR